MVTSERNGAGWDLWQPDEEWQYIPIFDERVCPICEGFEGVWNGTQIPFNLPDTDNNHPFQDLANNERYPNVHDTYLELKGKCRCVIRFNDYLRTLADRLMAEIEVLTV